MNYGYLYNKEYYRDLKFDATGKAKSLASEPVETILNRSIRSGNAVNLSGMHSPMISSFELKTVYPGLLAGSGYSHELGHLEDEFKLGFSFDHTYGIPIIPGSSVKGLLRHAIEEDSSYFTDLLNSLNYQVNVSREEFIKQIFDGTGISIYQRDVFLDAYPVSTQDKLFGSDYITPHKNPLQDPNPIKFLRINPNVTFRFEFILHDNDNITAEMKRNLFNAILLDFGIGAKTNVGYGQFTV